MEDKTKVVVIGGAGMLGSMVARVLVESPEFRVVATGSAESSPFPRWGVVWVPWRAEQTPIEFPDGLLDGADYLVNCAWATKPVLKAAHSPRDEAELSNYELPMALEDACAERGARMIHMSTDCVFTGHRGHYLESDRADCKLDDIYGYTKAAADEELKTAMILRCSIVGPELREPSRHLLEWVASSDELITGYQHHYWNGLTTWFVARIIKGVIETGAHKCVLQHLIPADSCSKERLVALLAQHFRRGRPVDPLYDADAVVDRRLGTAHPERNRALWRAAGFSEPWTIGSMIESLSMYLSVSDWPRRHRGEVFD